MRWLSRSQVPPAPPAMAMLASAQVDIGRGALEQAVVALHAAKRSLTCTPDDDCETLCCGLAALVELERGRRGEAWALADLTWSKMQKNRPRRPEAVEAYTSIASVYRALAFPAELRQVARALRKFARNHPTAEGAAARVAEQASIAAGKNPLLAQQFFRQMLPEKPEPLR